MLPIVVGIDGSPASLTALSWGAHLAAASDAPLHAVMAAPATTAELPPDAAHQHRTESEEQLRAWCDPITRPYGLRYIPEVTEVDPRQALREISSRLRARALVVGAIGTSGTPPGLLRIGSVAEYLAHHTTVPLVVVAPDAPATVHDILVGVDGSTYADAATTWCARIAAVTGAKVHVVSVARPLVGGWETIPDRKLRGEWIKDLTDAGIDVSCQVVHDLDPANGLLGAAAKADADLMVVGMRGLGGFLGLRAGGVALKTLHRADRTVALVPPWH